jgi:hypothetical protein
LVADPGLPAPPRVRIQRWAIDTRFSGEAYAWRHHLLEAGLDPDDLRTGSISLTPLGGSPQSFPLRDADLWLCSNLPTLKNRPWRLELDEGLAVRDVGQLPNPEVNCPLIGMRALVDSGLTIRIDLAHNTFSMWTPGPWHRRVSLTVHRALSGFSTLSSPWSFRSGARGQN